jgi:hypothetical protein
MKFFIKKGSNYPVLKFPLTQNMLEEYDITDDMLDSVAVTFSMVNEDNGLFRIANKCADLIINRNRPDYPDEEEYTLTFQFTEKQTNKVGIFLGEFVLDFLDTECKCKIKLPTTDKIYIIISDTITKTSVI